MSLFGFWTSSPELLKSLSAGPVWTVERIPAEPIPAEPLEEGEPAPDDAAETGHVEDEDDPTEQEVL